MLNAIRDALAGKPWLPPLPAPPQPDTRSRPPVNGHFIQAWTGYRNSRGNRHLLGLTRARRPEEDSGPSDDQQRSGGSSREEVELLIFTDQHREDPESECRRQHYAKCPAYQENTQEDSDAAERPVRNERVQADTDGAGGNQSRQLGESPVRLGLHEL